jgi:site-specific recombinase XerC
MADRNRSIEAKFTDGFVAKKEGSRGTRQRAHSTFIQLAEMAEEQGWKGLSPQTITVKQAKRFVELRVKKGIKPKGIQTEVSAIRRAMKGVGRHLDVVNMFTSKALGVPMASRKGTGIAISDTVYETALEKAPVEIAALMRVQSSMGLRLNEVIECRDSLKEWVDVLGNGGHHVHVVEGTKGGKQRIVYIHPERHAAVHAAVLNLFIVTNGGKDFPIKTAKNGRAAARKYSQELANLGIKNEQSSHSMRRRFAVEQYFRYLKQGLDEKAALARLSQDLGHGDKRGRWIWNNYLANSIHEENVPT